MRFRFQVTVKFNNNAERIYFIETDAGNKQAAIDQVESLVNEVLEIVEIINKTQ